MKQTAFAAFVAFWSFVASLGALYALAGDPSPAGQDLPEVSMEQVAAHNTEDDCWMAIEGKVYDLSDYIPEHPTPASVLTPWCGKEATEGMRTKGYGRDHSPAAWGMLDEYLVGELAEVD
ncbi:MAG: cytochrome b5-like heme/steroid binding domain-containing protein [Halioglobus sp.]|nr:cytochrome b5-like heme/steroid binding domain-containing protein [Halioglobus sp.]